MDKAQVEYGPLQAPYLVSRYLHVANNSAQQYNAGGDAKQYIVSGHNGILNINYGSQNFRPTASIGPEPDQGFRLDCILDSLRRVSRLAMPESPRGVVWKPRHPRQDAYGHEAFLAGAKFSEMVVFTRVINYLCSRITPWSSTSQGLLSGHDGILILTSNRVGTFDEPFKSRIQLSLHYDKLKISQRRKIWRNFIERLRAVGEENVDFDDLVDHVEELAGHEMNGRQIRNAITTTRQLARYRGQGLCYTHLRHVIDVAGRFDKYLMGVNEGLTDDELAREGRYR